MSRAGPADRRPHLSAPIYSSMMDDLSIRPDAHYSQLKAKVEFHFLFLPFSFLFCFSRIERVCVCAYVFCFSLSIGLAVDLFLVACFSSFRLSTLLSSNFLGGQPLTRRPVSAIGRQKT